MKVFAFHLRKGGDGKTTITANAGWGLAQRGYRVAIVDADTQAHITKWMDAEREADYELADYFNGKCTAKDALFSVRENFFVMPTASVGSDLRDWAQAKFDRSPFIMRQLIRDLELLDIDLVLIDMAPDFGSTQRTMYLAVDEVLPVSSPAKLSEEGLTSLANDVKEINLGFGIDVSYSWLILNRVNYSIKEHRERLNDMEELRKNGFQTFEVPQCQAFPKAQSWPPHRRTIYDLTSKEKDAKTKEAVQSIEKIVDEIEAKIDGQE